MIHRLTKKKEQSRKVLILLLLIVAIFKKEIYEVVRLNWGVVDYLSTINRSLPEVLLLFSMIFVYLAFEILSEISLDRWRPFRSVFMGKDDIETKWVEAVFENGALVAGTFISLEYDNEAKCYVMIGDTFNVDGTRIGDFRTEMTIFNGDVLKYFYFSNWFESNRQDRNRYLFRVEDHGSGQLEFHRNGKGQFAHFRGNFIRSDSNKTYVSEGETLDEFLNKIRECEIIAKRSGWHLGRQELYYSQLKDQVKQLSGRTNWLLLQDQRLIVIRAAGKTSISRAELIRVYLEFKGITGEQT